MKTITSTILAAVITTASFVSSADVMRYEASVDGAPPVSVFMRAQPAAGDTLVTRNACFTVDDVELDVYGGLYDPDGQRSVDDQYTRVGAIYGSRILCAD